MLCLPRVQEQDRVCVFLSVILSDAGGYVNRQPRAARLCHFLLDPFLPDFSMIPEKKCGGY